MKASCAIYCRANANVASLADQEQACRDLAARLGYEVAAVYRDVASGTDPERPGLDELRAAIAGGDVRVVVTHDKTRLGRSAAALAGLLGTATVHFVSQPEAS